MYRTSDEPRFVRKKTALQRAFIQLTLAKQTVRISVKELTEHANVNRMTFYSHYDEIGDILREFVDETVSEIMEGAAEDTDLGIEDIFRRATTIMEENLDFYRLVAQDERFEFYRMQFRHGFADLFARTLFRQSPVPEESPDLATDMLASAITYAYLDWLAGRYGDMPLEMLVESCERFVGEHVEVCPSIKGVGAGDRPDDRCRSLA